MHDNLNLAQILILLIAAVITIPLFRYLKLGTILGYLIAGTIIGPWGFGFISAVEDIQHIAEFGVIFLLFLIGIELNPLRLWRLRRFVFGLGSLQVMVTGLLITGIAIFLGIEVRAAIITGFALALSSTAFAMQLLIEKRQLNTHFGRKAFSILLLQDLAVVPLLAMVSMLAKDTSVAVGVEFALLDAIVAITAVILIGRYLLNPFLHMVASSRTSEIFMAAAILSILGTGWVLEKVGLSMALGAFLAGLMLSESHFRHQISADVQPFRAILLGLYFMFVGMSIDLGLLQQQYWVILGILFGLLALKITVIAVLSKYFGSPMSERLHTAILLSQSGEFAFILFGLATMQGVMDSELSQLLTVVVALSMATTPILLLILEKLDRQYISRSNEHPLSELSKLEKQPEIIIAGFGRVGRGAAKLLDKSKTPYVALDNKADRIARYHANGVPVFFGDVSRNEILAAAGAAEAKVLLITLDDFEAAIKLVELVHEHFPSLKIFARAHNQEHCQKLRQAGATLAISETMEISLQLGAAAMGLQGIESDDVVKIVNIFRNDFYKDIDNEKRT